MVVHVDLNRPNRPDRILRILFLNVLSSYGKQGIAKALAVKSEEHALCAGISSFQVRTGAHMLANNVTLGYLHNFEFSVNYTGGHDVGIQLQGLSCSRLQRSSRMEIR